jgi:hypothetical protein
MKYFNHKHFPFTKINKLDQKSLTSGDYKETDLNRFFRSTIHVEHSIRISLTQYSFFWFKINVSANFEMMTNAEATKKCKNF